MSEFDNLNIYRVQYIPVNHCTYVLQLDRNHPTNLTVDYIANGPALHTNRHQDYLLRKSVFSVSNRGALKVMPKIPSNVLQATIFSFSISFRSDFALRKLTTNPKIGHQQGAKDTSWYNYYVFVFVYYCISMTVVHGVDYESA